jgi:hypothetical protein
MPFPIAEIRERTKTSTKTYRGGPHKLTITYRLDRFTVDENSAFQDEINTLSRKDEQGNHVSAEPNKELFEKLSERLEQLIVSADWEDDKGPIPIVAKEMCERLPSGVLMFALEIIAEGITGKK